MLKTTLVSAMNRVLVRLMTCLWCIGIVGFTQTTAAIADSTVTVSTLAGTAGVRGSADGSGAAAQFRYPYGIAVGTAGNVYVADTSNHTIRKITASGVVSTLAGTAGVYGSADGSGAAAQFGNPSGIAADTAGNLYVADYGNSTIRMITLAINLSAEIPVVTQAPPISTFPALTLLLTDTAAFVNANQSQLSPGMRSYLQAEILRLQSTGRNAGGFFLFDPLSPTTKTVINGLADTLQFTAGSVQALCVLSNYVDWIFSRACFAYDFMALTGSRAQHNYRVFRNCNNASGAR